MTRTIALILALTTLASCASYTEAIKDAKVSITTGDMTVAIEYLNKLLEVESERVVPDALKASDTLLLLERATLLQAKGNYKMSARDMILVDQRLEGFDIGRSDAKKLASYFYSDSIKDYRAPSYERLLLNTLNMINFLAVHDLEGARVEARRFQIMESFYLDDSDNSELPGLIGLGNYLAGATYETSRDYQKAARSYSRAWHFGMHNEELRGRLRDLYRITGYKPKSPANPVLDALYKEATETVTNFSHDDYVEKYQNGDTLIFVQYGLVPYKSAERIAASRALASPALRGSSFTLSTSTRARASELITAGSLNWVHLPNLTTLGIPPRTTRSARLTIDGQPRPLRYGMEVTRQVQKAWLEMAGPVLAAALTRMITRAVIGQAGRAISSVAGSSDPTMATVGALGWVASTGVQVALGASDVPDTRSWTTLPAYIQITRTRLTRGLHTAEVRVEGRTERRTLPVWPNKLNVINFSKNR